MSCYKASGKVFLRKKTLPNQPFQFLGNAQAVLNTAVEESSVPDYTSVAGGNACVDKVISKVTLDLTVYDFKPANLAKAVKGTLSIGSLIPVVAEAVNAFTGELSMLSKLVNLAIPMVVKDNAGVTTYVLGTDYTVEQGGIVVKAGGAIATAIAAAVTTPKFVVLKVNYTPTDVDIIEALTQAGDQYEVVILTQNRADAGKFGRWDIYTVDFGPTATLNLITREFGSFQLQGEALPDPTQGDGVTESTYFTIATQP